PGGGPPRQGGAPADARTGGRARGVVRDRAFQRPRVDEHRAIGARGKLLERWDDRRERRRDEHRVRGHEVVETRRDTDAVRLGGGARAFVVVVSGDVVPVAEREGERSTDEAEAGDADLHGVATCSVRPTARATCGSAAMSARKLSKLSD